MESDLDHYERLDFLLFVAPLGERDELTTMTDMSDLICEMMQLELRHYRDWQDRTGVEAVSERNTELERQIRLRSKKRLNDLIPLVQRMAARWSRF